MNRFYFWGNKSAEDLDEFLGILESMSEQEFHNYVNSEKNDFANWVENSLGRHELAHKLRNIFTINETISAVASELNVEEKIIVDDLINHEKSESVHRQEPAADGRTAAGEAKEVTKLEEDLLIKEIVEKNKNFKISEYSENAGSEVSGSKIVLSDKSLNLFNKLVMKDFLFGAVFGFVLGVIVLLIFIRLGFLQF